MIIEDLEKAYIEILGRENAKGTFYVKDLEDHGLTELGVTKELTVDKEQITNRAMSIASSSNREILEELNKLDLVVTRAKEDKAAALGLTLDAVEQAVVTEKVNLRSQIV